MSKKPQEFELPKFRENVQNKLLQVVVDADLRNSHDGLTILAKKAGINPSNLNAGEFIAFMNTSKSAIKFLIAGSEMLGYFKMPGHRKFNLDTLPLLSKYFNGREFHYDSALKEAIKNKFKK